MSRNFELLQSLGREPEMVQTSTENERALHAPFPVVASHFELGSVELEEVTKLVQRVFLLPATNAPRVVVFSGTEAGNGCSWICARAGEMLATQVAGSVCLVDANLRAPGLHEQFRIQNHCGLADALRQPDPVRGFVTPLGRPNLSILSCGSEAENAQGLLTSDRMRLRMNELRSEFDFILVDAAAINLSNDSIVLGCASDGVVLVLKANSSRREAARKAVQELQAAKARVLGAVLNQRTFPIPKVLYSRL